MKKQTFCTRHNLKLDSIDDPTERDKRLIQSVKLTPFEVLNKDGTTNKGRICKRCGYTLNEFLEQAVQPILRT